MQNRLGLNRLFLRKARAASVSDAAPMQPTPLDDAIAVSHKRKLHLIPIIPMAVVGFLIFLAIFANFVSPHDPKRSILQTA